jgi:hypothetical protein
MVATPDVENEIGADPIGIAIVRHTPPPRRRE